MCSTRSWIIRNSYKRLETSPLSQRQLSSLLLNTCCIWTFSPHVYVSKTLTHVVVATKLIPLISNSALAIKLLIFFSFVSHLVTCFLTINQNRYTNVSLFSSQLLAFCLNFSLRIFVNVNLAVKYLISCWVVSVYNWGWRLLT